MPLDLYLKLHDALVSAEVAYGCIGHRQMVLCQRASFAHVTFCPERRNLRKLNCVSYL